MTRLVDDLDGSQAAATLSFSLDGQSYEIDLSEPHLVAIRQALAPFVTAARTAPGGRRTGAATANGTPSRTPTNQAPTDKTPTNGTGPKPAPQRSRDLNTRPFQQPDLARPDAAAPAPPKPDRAPLVADPFNPQARPG